VCVCVRVSERGTSGRTGLNNTLLSCSAPKPLKRVLCALNISETPPAHARAVAPPQRGREGGRGEVSGGDKTAGVKQGEGVGGRRSRSRRRT
jgi:hypothetical protein